MPATQNQEISLLPGISSAIAEVNRRIRTYAKLDSSVFITGEPGTEKAFAAKMIHLLSARSQRPLHKISVSWKLPPDLGDRFRQCHGGTLIINLQREFPIDMQYTLLEMANDKAFGDPLSGEIVEADVRIILTTSLDVENLMGNTSLLPELVDMLEKRHIEIPPIRERPEDIPALVRYATNRALETGRSQARGADAQVLALFRMWKWPGNAEDLLLVTAESALNTESELIQLDDIPKNFIDNLPSEIIETARSVQLPRSAPPAMQSQTAVPRHAPVTTGPAPTPRTLERSSTIEEDFNEEDDTQEIDLSKVQQEYQKIPTGHLEPSVSQVADQSVEEIDENQVIDIQARKIHRLVMIARRLNAQSQMLANQMKGPIDQRLIDPMQFIESSYNPDEIISNALENEMDRTMDAILSLRRQVALLNKREQDTIMTARDLYRRLLLAEQNRHYFPDDEEIRQETAELADGLQEMDSIIQRVSGSFPKLSDDPEAGAGHNLEEEEARVIAEALRRARERDREALEETQTAALNQAALQQLLEATQQRDEREAKALAAEAQSFVEMEDDEFEPFAEGEDDDEFVPFTKQEVALHQDEPTEEVEVAVGDKIVVETQAPVEMQEDEFEPFAEGEDDDEFNPLANIEEDDEEQEATSEIPVIVESEMVAQAQAPAQIEEDETELNPFANIEAEEALAEEEIAVEAEGDETEFNPFANIEAETEAETEINPFANIEAEEEINPFANIEAEEEIKSAEELEDTTEINPSPFAETEENEEEDGFDLFAELEDDKEKDKEEEFDIFAEMEDENKFKRHDGADDETMI